MIIYDYLMFVVYDMLFYCVVNMFVLVLKMLIYVLINVMMLYVFEFVDYGWWVVCWLNLVLVKGFLMYEGVLLFEWVVIDLGVLFIEFVSVLV